MQLMEYFLPFQKFWTPFVETPLLPLELMFAQDTLILRTELIEALSLLVVRKLASCNCRGIFKTSKEPLVHC